MLKTAAFLLCAFLAGLSLAGCSRQRSTQRDYNMGEKVLVGPLTYSINDATWKSELGQGFQVRTPNQRFLLVNLSVTNGGGQDASIPLLQLEGANGTTFQELTNGDGVDQYLGILRNIAPAETLQGRVLFDAPLTSYRLRLVDGGDPAFPKYAWVQIPLNLNADAPLLNTVPGTATPGSESK
ncbi:MAG TPA: DUF4352 domain-containing protein [Bryobacteraceae bacterium]|nr:DUF4352 domain-containing protein [Bryobacteraceae bacterium]